MAKTGKPFLYVIDLDERGEFAFHIDDCEGKEVFDYRFDGSEEGESSIFEDGFMKNKNDMSGLTSYMRDMKVIGSDDYVTDEEQEIEEYNEEIGTMAKGGKVKKAKGVNIKVTQKPRIDAYRYLDIETSDNGINLVLNREGKEYVKELQEEGRDNVDIMDWLFEDVQGNSEWLYHWDMGESGFGMTNAPGITDGYYYEGEDIHNLYKTDYPESAEVYWFPNYMIVNPVEELFEKGEVFFTKADKMASGGSVDNSFGSIYNRVVKYIVKNEGISEEKARELVDGQEVWLRDMVEYQGEHNVSYLAEAITSDMGEMASGGSVKGGDFASYYAMHGGLFGGSYFNTPKMASGGGIEDDRFKAWVGEKEDQGYPVFTRYTGYAAQYQGWYKTKELAEKKAKSLMKKNKMAGGGGVGYEKFTVGTEVETTVFMSTEDFGGDEDVEVGTTGIVFSAPSDEEELVGVVMNGAHTYLPQDVLEVVKMAKGGGVDDVMDIAGVSHKKTSKKIDYQDLKRIEDSHPLGTVYLKDGKGYIASGYDWYEFDEKHLPKLKKARHSGKYAAGGSVEVESEGISEQELDKFVDYVYSFYGKGNDSVYGKDLPNGGYTKKQIESAVSNYIIDGTQKNSSDFTWGGGDSLDRERVRGYLESGEFKEGGKIGGRGWDDFKKGKRITKVKDFKIGEMYLSHSSGADNIVLITRGDSTPLNRDITYGGFIRPEHIKKGKVHPMHMEPEFAIWEHELKDWEFYEIKK